MDAQPDPALRALCSAIALMLGSHTISLKSQQAEGFSLVMCL